MLECGVSFRVLRANIMKHSIPVSHTVLAIMDTAAPLVTFVSNLEDKLAEENVKDWVKIAGDL